MFIFLCWLKTRNFCVISSSGRGIERRPQLYHTELEVRQKTQEANRQKSVCLGSKIRFDKRSSEAARQRSGSLCSQAGIPSPDTVL